MCLSFFKLTVQSLDMLIYVKNLGFNQLLITLS